MLRKQILSPATTPTGRGVATADTKDIASLATVLVTSETAEHPVDHLFDDRGGPGGTRWTAAEDGEQTLIIAFDTPQAIREVILEAEESHLGRTQVLTLSLSSDGGRTYRELLRQEFTFSPGGATFQAERWRVPADGVTHVRVMVRPDKGDAPGRASLTTLAIA